MMVEIRYEDGRMLYIRQHPLAFTIYISSVMASLLLLALPLENNSALANFLTSRFLETAWILLYGLGGWLGVTGMWRLKARREAVGCLLLSWVWLVDGYAIFVERGAGAAVLQTLILAVSVGFAIRAVVIYREARWQQRQLGERDGP